MRNFKFYILIIVIFLNFSSYSMKKAVVSITPIASIVAMLLEPEFEVSVISTSSGCPHHYHAKPGDLEKIHNAEIIIYVDDQFENFTKNLIDSVISSNERKIIKISEFNGHNIIGNGHPNWHIWLDLNNVINMLENLAKIITQKYPEIKEVINSNLERSRNEIKELIYLKEKKLANLSNIILLSDSLEYFFKDYENVVKHYMTDQMSLKSFNKLKEKITSNSKCLILSSEQNPKLFQKLNLPIIQLESENWTTSEKSLKNIFNDNYLGMVNQLRQCK